MYCPQLSRTHGLFNKPKDSGMMCFQGKYVELLQKNCDFYHNKGKQEGRKTDTIYFKKTLLGILKPQVSNFFQNNHLKIPKATEHKTSS